MGGCFVVVEFLDFFSLYTKEKHGLLSVFLVFLIGVAATVFTRRPVSKIVSKVPSKDLKIEVRIANLLEMNADIVISTNTTFDTSMADGLIAPNSLQGQVAHDFFNGKTDEIDRQIEKSLGDTPFVERKRERGKSKEYPMGTVAIVEGHGKFFYFVAMSALNSHGTAGTTPANIDITLNSLWRYINDHGERRDIAMPIIGTGRGRITIPKKKMIERIADSFVSAANHSLFAKKLIIVIHPSDQEDAGINLFRVKDYLDQSFGP